MVQAPVGEQVAVVVLVQHLARVVFERAFCIYVLYHCLFMDCILDGSW